MTINFISYKMIALMLHDLG